MRITLGMNGKSEIGLTAEVDAEIRQNKFNLGKC